MTDFFFKFTYPLPPPPCQKETKLAESPLIPRWLSVYSIYRGGTNWCYNEQHFPCFRSNLKFLYIYFLIYIICYIYHCFSQTIFFNTKIVCSIVRAFLYTFPLQCISRHWLDPEWAKLRPKLTKWTSFQEKKNLSSLTTHTLWI